VDEEADTSEESEPEKSEGNHSGESEGSQSEDSEGSQTGESEGSQTEDSEGSQTDESAVSHADEPEEEFEVVPNSRPIFELNRYHLLAHNAEVAFELFPSPEKEKKKKEAEAKYEEFKREVESRPPTRIVSKTKVVLQVEVGVKVWVLDKDEVGSYKAYAGRVHTLAPSSALSKLKRNKKIKKKRGVSIWSVKFHGYKSPYDYYEDDLFLCQNEAEEAAQAKNQKREARKEKEKATPEITESSPVSAKSRVATRCSARVANSQVDPTTPMFVLCVYPLSISTEMKEEKKEF
jgi:hypothetical protein